jgi:TrmH family RNA methyltransferase
MVTKSQVKYIQSLGQKKFRDEEGVFVAEGPKITGELLENGNISLSALFATRPWIEKYTALINRLPAGAVQEINDRELERISFLSTPHQVLGVFKKPQPSPIHLAGSFSLMLEGIQDPGNMGTIIRTADWFGLRQIICSMDSSDAYGPKTVQSTMGSIARVNLLYTHLPGFIAANKGTRIYAATLGGKPLQEFGRIKEGIILIGNESKGISPALAAAATEQVTIPGKGGAESLNAAVATGILLSHLV